MASFCYFGATGCSTARLNFFPLPAPPKSDSHQRCGRPYLEQDCLHRYMILYPPPPCISYALVIVIVKKNIRYLGVQLGNITSDAAYARVIARMLLRARAMAALPLGLEGKAFLFASWVAPVCYLTARAYQPSQHVCSQMDMVHRTALGISTWDIPRVLLNVRPALPWGGVGGWVWQNFRVGGCPTTPPPQGRVGLCGGLGSIEPVPLLSFFCCRFRVTWARIVCALCRMRRG